MPNRMTLIATLWATPGLAGPVDDVFAAARAHFDRMPTMEVVDQIAGHCGATPVVNPAVAYCTSENRILLADHMKDAAQTPYLIAHLLGHAVQVQHGVADIALREIRRQPSMEAELRGHVARQVDCIAGVILKQAGVEPVSLIDLFTEEPFTGTHWGRNPLRIGPQVSITLDDRDIWLARGQEGRIEDCASGPFDASLLVAAFRP